MAFHFQLDSLLRLQMSHERRERMLLERIARKIAATRARIGEIDDERRAAARAQTGRLASGLTASEMHFAAACDSELERLHRKLSDELMELQKDHRKQSGVYLEIRIKLDTLEHLRAQKREEYRREMDRRQQQALDDLFLMRANRKATPDVPVDHS